MITTAQIETAVNAAFPDAATLTAFLVAGKLALDVAAIEARVRNAQSARSQAVQDAEVALQALQAEKAALQAQIDALGQ